MTSTDARGRETGHRISVDLGAAPESKLWKRSLLWLSITRSLRILSDLEAENEPSENLNSYLKDWPEQWSSL